jgi:hypothetical protein
MENSVLGQLDSAVSLARRFHEVTKSGTRRTKRFQSFSFESIDAWAGAELASKKTDLSITIP